MGYTVDIDTGGTFTDGFFTGRGRSETVKVPTTPHDLTVCFMECIKAGAARFGTPLADLLYDCDIIRFSNTIGTNTIIQRNGSKLGLLVTSGLEGLAPTFATERKQPLVMPDMVMGIAEQVESQGRVVKAPDEAEALQAAQALIDQGARCLLVCFANSELNPANERAVRWAIKREYPRDYLGSLPVFLASDISSRSGQAPRINAVVLNAYIHAKLVRLLYRAGEDLRRHLYGKNLFIVHNNGAVARVARTRAINTYNSGPAAGLLGARLVGQLYGCQDLISADMGGTSFDIGFVRQGQPSYTLTPDVEGFAVNVPMLSIRAIGAGGGSIASVEEGRLQVGPQSAGSMPGPVCFDLGGLEPTVADADLVLGVLDSSYFLGGSFRLNRDKAAAALQERVAAPLGLSLEEAALAVKRQVDEKMGLEIKKIKEEIWPGGEEPLMVVYGGAGATHCCDLARAAGLRRLVITPFSAVFSAFSSSSMDVGHLYYRRVDLPFGADQELPALDEPLAAMREESQRDMRGEGFDPAQTTSALELFISPAGGGVEVKLLAQPGFHRDHAQIASLGETARLLLARQGAPAAAGQLVLTTLGLMVQAAVPHYKMPVHPRRGGDHQAALKGRRPVWLGDGAAPVEVPVYERGLLGHGHELRGPALLESEHTTLLVPQGWRLSVDQYNHCLLEDGV